MILRAVFYFGIGIPYYEVYSAWNRWVNHWNKVFSWFPGEVAQMYTNVHGSSKIVSFLFFAAELYKHNMKIYETWFVGSLVVSCLAFSDS